MKMATLIACVEHSKPREPSYMGRAPGGKRVSLENVSQTDAQPLRAKQAGSRYGLVGVG